MGFQELYELQQQSLAQPVASAEPIPANSGTASPATAPSTNVPAETAVVQARRTSAALRPEGEVEGLRAARLAGASVPGGTVSTVAHNMCIEEHGTSLIHNTSSSSQQPPEDALNSTAEIDQTAQESSTVSINQTSPQANDRAEGQPNRHDPPLQVPSESSSVPRSPDPATTRDEITNRFAEYMARVEARRVTGQRRRQERLARLDEMLDQIAAGVGSSSDGASLPSEAEIDANTTTFTWSGPEDATCTICIEDLVPGAEVRRLRCGHVYHRECVDAWLRRSRLCCLCKQAIDS